MFDGDRKFSRGENKTGNWTEVWPHNIVNVLSDTELYALKWLIVGYVGFTSITKTMKATTAHDKCAVTK